MSKVQQLGVRTGKFFHLLIQTAGFLATVLTLLTAFGITSAAFGFLTHAPLVAGIGFLIIIFSGILYILFYTLLEGHVVIHSSHSSQPTSTDTLKYPPPPSDEDVEVVLKEIVYEYSLDEKTMRQWKRMKVKALRNGVAHFTDRYRWTGSGVCIVQSLTTGFEVVNQRKEEIEEIWDYFDVKFPHPLHKGEEFDFTLQWELVDKEKLAVPFLSTMIERETMHLLMQVKLPRELAPKRAYCYVFANYLETLPVETHDIQYSPATGCIHYEVPQPKKFHKYTIRWYHN
jgi:hypothetical protein